MTMDAISNYKCRIEETLSTLIPGSSPFFASLYEGARYSLLAKAKRLRPLLTVCTAEMVQEGSLEAALRPACAIEMVHTYSLIHDDLPCMDNDDFRRGLPTLHKVYTDGHAVLMGDYLLTYAFEVLATAPMLSSDQKIALIQKLGFASGGDGMIGGQIMDIEQSQEVHEMHARKTAALFCAAIEFGGIIACCTPEVMELLKNFGAQFGALFQTVDDILDGDHPFGMERAQEAALTLSDETFATLDKLPFNSILLKKITESVAASWKQEHLITTV